MKKILYLDNSATTPVRREVFLVMKPYWMNNFGNPGSITKFGVKAKQVVEKARKCVADCLKARPQEIIFTSGGTESNNLAIFGVINNLEKKGVKISGMHFITTNIEHSSVLECFKEIERRGGKVDYLEVNNKGLINIKDLRKVIQPNTVLVSIGYANGEIGVIQPIKEIAKEIRHARKCHQGNSLNLQKGVSLMTTSYPIFHTDASQAGLYCNLNILELGIDLMTIDAQKIFGPKGVGLLFVKSRVELSPIIFGGGQEGGLRSGTENIPLIVGMSKALELARGSVSLPLAKGRVGERLVVIEKTEKMISLRNYFWQKIQTGIPEAILNGDLENRLPNNLNISIPGIDPEFTVLCLDEQGIICSTKSACNHNNEGSLVVSNLYKGLAFEGQALGKSTLRFSLGEDITKADINFVVSSLKKIVQKQLKFKK
jgi:cysteine desulfurase